MRYIVLEQQLYNFANSDSGKCPELSDTALNFGRERISLRKVFAGDGKAGMLAWAVVSRGALGMNMVSDGYRYLPTQNQTGLNPCSNTTSPVVRLQAVQTSFT